MPGVFITFEGPEGAGKSTQTKLLKDALERAGYAVLLTREPGGTPLGDAVRAALLNPEFEITALSEFLLFSASRAQLCKDTILPKLAANYVVISDRFFDSSLAYQGFGRGLNLDFLREVTWEATGGLRPHVTVLLDLEPKLGLERAAKVGTPDRLEQADLGFHQKVRAGFLDLASLEPERFLVLDATKSTDIIHEQILSAVTGSLSAM
ncbi:MAG: dTMP kinase [Deinococcota bacterium]|jgi:dTMP kinase